MVSRWEGSALKTLYSMVDDWGFAKVGCRVLAPSFDGTRPRGSVDGWSRLYKVRLCNSLITLKANGK
jgi:hypothetical protein